MTIYDILDEVGNYFNEKTNRIVNESSKVEQHKSVSNLIYELFSTKFKEELHLTFYKLQMGLYLHYWRKILDKSLLHKYLLSEYD